MSKKIKRLIIAAVIVLGVCGAAVAAVIIINKLGKSPVNVYNVSEFAMTDYWGDSSETYGTVTTDRLQKVYCSSTQVVTAVHVSEGDEVKVGDVLLEYDSTLSDIELEKAEINVSQIEVNITKAQLELTQIQNLQPHSEALITPDSSWITYISQETPAIISGTGTEDDPLYILYGDEDEIDSSFMEKMFNYAVTERLKQKAESESSASGSTTSTGTASGSTDSAAGADDESSEAESAESETSGEGEEDTEEYEDISDNVVYAAFVSRNENALNGEITSTWGLRLELKEDGLAFAAYTPMLSEEILKADVAEDPYYEEYGSDYTASEIAQMRNEKEAEIVKLQNDLKLAQVELEKLKTEVNNSTVVSKIDGVVQCVRDVDEAKAAGTAVVEVSAGGGYLIEASISELDNVTAGQTVTVTSWQNGVTCEGVVTSIGSYPVQSEIYSSGNPNVSYYEMIVAVDGSENLEEGSSVSVAYQADETDTDSFYIENMFVLNQEGKNYVYLKGEDGQLKLQQVSTGKSVWGEYTEILGGLTLEDRVAFPYGSDVFDGAQTTDADSSALYSSY